MSLMIIGSLNLISFAQASDSTSENVPAPQISESHIYNKQEMNGNTAQANYDNEAWGITINQGDMNILISARNYSNSNGVYVDYGMNFMFSIGGKNYIAMFTIDQVLIKIGNDTVIVPLKNCDGFQVTYSPVIYDGTIPTLECNITYKNIRIYADAPDSTFDLTVINHIRGDWNQTSIKVETLLNFGKMNLSQYAPGESFTAEIHYIMQLTDPGMKDGSPPDFNTIKPSNYTDSNLEYNMTKDDGSPYSLSKLDMNDSYTIYNASGAYSAMGYSRIDPPSNSGSIVQYNPNSRVVTHGFPNLIYKDTLSMKSDPEITVYHDKVTNQSDASTLWIPLAAFGAIVAILAIGVVVVFLKKRKKKASQK
jgi:hypothetical protein